MGVDVSNLLGLVASPGTRAVLRKVASGIALAGAVAMEPVAASARGLQAQSFSLSGLSADVDNPLLGDMLGGTLALETPIRRGPAYMRFGVSRLSASGTSFGSPCAGLILPGTCPPETLRTTGSITWGAVGLGGRVASRANVELHVSADVVAGTASTRVRGETSSRTLAVAEGVIGAAGGASLRWFPGAGRWGAQLSTTYVRFVLATGSDCVDCYVPFPDDFGATQVSLGVAYRLR